MGIGFDTELGVHENNKTQNIIVQVEISVGLDEDEESTWAEVGGAVGVVVVLEVVEKGGHGVEGADEGELAEELVVEGGRGGEVGLARRPFEEAEGGRLVVLAAEGIEELSGGEVGREDRRRRRRRRRRCFWWWWWWW